MQVRYLVHVWDSSCKKLVCHLIGGHSIFVRLCHASAVYLSFRRLEFEHADERDLLVQLERIYIFIVKLDNG
jgi:hypothetical protein